MKIKEDRMPELENIKVAFDKFAEETKEFLQKPRYVYCEDKKYIVDTELDVLVDIDGVIDRLNTQCFQKKELLRNIRIKDQQIADLQYQLEVSEKALELACEELMGDLEFNDELDKHYNLQANIEYFKTKAREMLKSE